MLRRSFIVISLVWMGLVSCETEAMDDGQDNSGQNPPVVEENVVT